MSDFRIEQLLAVDNRPDCCDEARDAEAGGWSLGSHYHCPECDRTCSMMGHWREGHGWGEDRVTTPGHYCCEPRTCSVGAA